MHMVTMFVNYILGWTDERRIWSRKPSPKLSRRRDRSIVLNL